MTDFIISVISVFVICLTLLFVYVIVCACVRLCTFIDGPEPMDEVTADLNQFKSKQQREAAQKVITKMIDEMGIYRILGMIEKEWRRINE